MNNKEKAMVYQYSICVTCTMCVYCTGFQKYNNNIKQYTESNVYLNPTSFAIVFNSSYATPKYVTIPVVSLTVLLTNDGD